MLRKVPSLSLLSVGDAFEQCVFLVLAAFVIAIQDPVLAKASKNKPLRWSFGLLLATGFFGLLAVGFRMSWLAHEYKDYSGHWNLLRKEDMDRIDGMLPKPSDPPDRQPALTVTEDGQINPGPYSSRLGSVLRRIVDEYHARPNKTDPSQSLLYLEYENVDGKRRPFVFLNKSAYRVRSPFAENGGVWQHSIVAAERQELPTVCGLGNASSLDSAGCLQFSPATAHQRSEPCLSEQRNADESPSSRYVCFDDRGTRLFELERKDKDIFLYAYPNALVRVGGTLESSKEYRLKVNDIVHVSGENSDPTKTRDFIYLGPQQPRLAYTLWRNGGPRRVFPVDDLLPMAMSLGMVADEVKPQGDLKLTIDLTLNRQLQKSIEQYAQNNEPYKSDDDFFTSKHIAVTVLDAFSGEVLALPSWPVNKLTAADLEASYPQHNRRQQELMLRNFNFFNHVVGSTVKPLVFSAMAAELNPLNVADLKFYNVPDGRDLTHKHATIDGIPLGIPWDCHSKDSPIDSSTFLIKSLDFYETALGISGMALSRDDWAQAVESKSCLSGSTKVAFNSGNNFKDETSCLDLRVLDSEVGLTMDDVKSHMAGSTGNVPSIKQSTFDRTLVFAGLKHVFDTQPHDNSDGDAIDLNRKFLPSLYQGAQPAVYVTDVVPDAVTPDPRVPYDLVLCLLGGGNGCRYNNVWMAQAAARISTRERVFATLEKSDAAGPAEKLPLPLSDNSWWEKNLEEPMRKVGLNIDGITGTAARMQKLVRMPPTFRILYRTGTLQEDQAKTKESEALMFIVGAWNGHGFIPRRTLTGFLYLQDSKPIDDRAMRKFSAAAPIVQAVIDLLASNEPTELATKKQPSVQMKNYGKRPLRRHNNRKHRKIPNG